MFDAVAKAHGASSRFDRGKEAQQMPPSDVQIPVRDSPAVPCLAISMLACGGPFELRKPPLRTADSSCGLPWQNRRQQRICPSQGSWSALQGRGRCSKATERIRRQHRDRPPTLRGRPFREARKVPLSGRTPFLGALRVTVVSGWVQSWLHQQLVHWRCRAFRGQNAELFSATADQICHAAQGVCFIMHGIVALPLDVGFT